MNSWLPLLIEYLRNYGWGILGATIILQCNGIPVGANFLVMASGAFAYSGEFQLYSLIMAVWVFLIIGDISSYFLWRYLGQWAMQRFPRLQITLHSRLQRSGRLFEKYGVAAISFTRFPLSALGPGINIISGTTRFRLDRFIMAAALGEICWAGFNLGVGYWFGDSWEDISLLLPAVGIWLGLLALLVVSAYLLAKSLRKK